MKLVTAKYQGDIFLGKLIEEENVVFNLSLAAQEKGMEFPESMLEGLQLEEKFLEKIYELSKAYRENLLFTYGLNDPDLEWMAPIPRPVKNIFCVGKNYRDHAVEMGSEADIPEHVMIFTKAPTTVIGHQADILRHEELTDELDYEGELAVVIGKRGKGITCDAAMDHVFGYTIINDVTARDLQKKHKQFLIGKSLDASCPMGPWIVPKEDIPNPHELKITTKVNGEVRQDGNTRDFIFTIPEIIETLSKGMTLEPGDVIATGTPAGVGKGFKPPRLLNSGDTIEITVEGIGTLVNNVV
ncbi:2-keto-4-pentenoate hydratase/2-oxohepta-3-ene-1,7-dioic acid hydratase (catechol pathway) [Fictibacillus solisalsi]|uniref:2-keto-4-pentenoate hydratase/2-oxohepta-3-ene-1,7-dioic acid hydratase (Catechol pathway) n=1 Tax=Fictibacillus solisalsi TaxID=459525 RepID=A0A1G9UE24_9BACL|nr:fumarylacetoacetate hydrolase family protein [Fictibacillus solisalsi]SDM58179.1 2-keto-4-pentenoate hydratase/2-oxohepta-3-ene-1,7-dioic acid hydratase (catechol pathway) [Fictibacillus solisalsi]